MIQYNIHVTAKRWRTIGLIFALISFACTFTIAVPMFTLFPAAFIEQWISMHFENLPIHAGLIMIFLLLTACIAALIWIPRRVIRVLDMQRAMSNKEIIVYMTIYYLIVHSLFFYMYYGLFTNFASDALYLIGAMFSFPFSSTVLYLIGLFTAMYIKKKIVVVDPSELRDPSQADAIPE